MVSFFMALVFWAGAYLSFYSGGFRSDVYDPSQVAWAGGGAVQETGPPDPMVVGRRLYTANCVACHQPTGQGVAGQFPTLVDSEWVVGGDWVGDNHLVKIMLHGLQGPILVKGQPYNGAMPPWNHLNDDQLASILTYIRNEWGNSALPITADRIAQIREETADVRQPYTQVQLQAMEAVWFEPGAAEVPGEAAEDNGIAPDDAIPEGDDPAEEEPAAAV
jgi:mono/diheme cytochrome c family protein